MVPHARRQTRARHAMVPLAHRRSSSIFRLTLAAGVSSGVRGLIFEGILPTRTTGDFGELVGKFCFDYDPTSASALGSQTVGSIGVEVINEGGRNLKFGPGSLYFLAFDDEHQHWKKVRQHWDSTTCQEKINAASLILQIDMDSPVFTNLVTVHEHLHPRFWYFTFVGCDLPPNSDIIRYKLHAQNTLWAWQQEFSLDHSNLLFVQMALFVGFTMSGLGAFYATVVRKEAKEMLLQEHPYVQFLLMAYCGSACSTGAFLLHYMLLVHNGYGSQRVRFLGVIFGIAANGVMYLMSLLASTGWAISTTVLPHRRCFIGLIALVAGAQGLCELHAELMVSQSTQLFSYAGPMGALMLVLKLFLFMWFAFQVRQTWLDEVNEQRRRFYKWLGLGVGVWALTVPIVALLAFEVTPWFRYKVVAGFELASRFLALAVLTQLFCGPLSPLCHENIFRLRHVQDSPVLRKVEGWSHLDTGERVGVQF